MFIVISCLIISILQLTLINIIVKPRSFYLCIFHFFLIYPVIFNQLVPLFLKLITPAVGMEIGIELAQAYVINFIYILVCLIFWRIFTSVYTKGYLSQQFAPPNRTICLISIVSILYNLFKLVAYLRIVELDLDALFFPFNTFFVNVFKVVPFLFLFLLYKNKNIIGLTKFLIYISVLTYFASIIPTGHRSSLILPGILMLFYILNISIYKKITYSVICLILFAQVADIYKSFRIILSADESFRSQEYYSSSFIDEVYFRLSVNNEVSAGIVEIINTNKPVGIEPLRSSLFAIIPSSYLDNEKSWPGSIDGTEFGVLPRIAHEYLYQAGQNMSEYMYPLHPVWELGYIYYFINMLLSIIIFLLIEKISFFIGDRKLLIAISSMLPFSYSYTFTPIVLLLQQITYVAIPGILIFVCYGIICKLNKILFLNVDQKISQ